MGVPPVISHFEGWDLSQKKQSFWGSPVMEGPQIPIPQRSSLRRSLLVFGEDVAAVDHDGGQDIVVLKLPGPPGEVNGPWPRTMVVLSINISIKYRDYM